MSKPEMKRALVVERCPNPKALSINTATKEAALFVRKVREEYSDDHLYSTDRDVRIPDSFVIAVSPCFDIDEVEKYLQDFKS